MDIKINQKVCSIPLLKDNHTHPYFYSTMNACLNLQSITDKKSAMHAIENYFSKSQISSTTEEKSALHKIHLILGWIDSAYSIQYNEIEEYPPIIIFNVSLHHFLANSKAIALISQNYKEFQFHYSDKHWIEKNLTRILTVILNTQSIHLQSIAAYFSNLERYGFGFAEDMFVSNKAYLDAIIHSPFKNKTAFWSDLTFFNSLSNPWREQIKGIKLFADGALGPQTAAISEPYTHGGNGILLYTKDALIHDLLTIYSLRKPVAIHAIGDRAIDLCVDAAMQLSTQGIQLPIRIEHCQFISFKTAKKAKTLNISLCMQPNFNHESHRFLDRLSQNFLSRNNPFRMLIDKVGYTPGVDLLFGSDGMPHAVQTALEQSFDPPLASQSLSLKECIAGYGAIDNYV